MKISKTTSRAAIFCVTLNFAVCANSAWAQAQPTNAPQAARPNRPGPPARDPHSPGYVEAKELPDGEVPPANVDGNFIIGPTHRPAPELAPRHLVG